MSQYMTDPVILITADEVIEGILHYPVGIRLSDALNAPQQREAQFLVLTRATVRSRATGEELLKSELLLTARNAIRMVVPRLELTALSLPGLQIRADSV
jgi:hypothetical protein